MVRMVFILCVLFLFHRASRPPPGLHLDVLKGEKLVQVFCVVYGFTIYKCKMLELVLSMFFFIFKKLMVDEKKVYMFGRNPQVDVCIDHASCSRVHAAFVYHKHLERAFLVDLASSKCKYKRVINLGKVFILLSFPSLAHGTFIGSMRLEANKPTQLPVDTTFHFGGILVSLIVLYCVKNVQKQLMVVFILNAASTRMYILREKPPNVGPRPIMEELEKASADGEGGLLGLPETDSELDVRI